MENLVDCKISDIQIIHYRNNVKNKIEQVYCVNELEKIRDDNTK